MKLNRKEIPACFSALLLSCGGNVTADTLDTPQNCIMNDGGQKTPDADDACGEWQKDHTFRTLAVQGSPMEFADGLALVSSELYATIRNASGGSLARRVMGAWELESLPAPASIGLILKSDENGRLFLAAQDANGKAMTFVNSGGKWSELVGSNQLSTIDAMTTAGDGTLYVFGHDAFGKRLLVNVSSEGATTSEAPETGDVYAINDMKYIGTGSLMLVGQTQGDTPSCVLMTYETIGKKWQTHKTDQYCREAHRITGVSPQNLWVTGQSQGQHAAIWSLNTATDEWRAFSNSNAMGYTPILSVRLDMTIAAGYSIPHVSDAYGSFTHLWVTELEAQASYNGKESLFTESTVLVEEISGQPLEIAYDAKMETAFLLTTRDLYTRRCRL